MINICRDNIAGSLCQQGKLLCVESQIALVLIIHFVYNGQHAVYFRHRCQANLFCAS